MKVILLADIPRIGRRGEVRDVHDGYARNFLLPKNLAQEATPEVIRQTAQKRAHRAADAAKEASQIKAAVAQLNGYEMTISGKANEHGHLFSGISAEEIVRALPQNIKGIAAKDIALDKPIKEVGEYGIEIKKNGLQAEIKLKVQAIK